MKTIDLAADLGLTPQMTNRLIKQGMPRVWIWRLRGAKTIYSRSARNPQESAAIAKNLINQDNQNRIN